MGRTDMIGNVIKAVFLTTLLLTTSPSWSSEERPAEIFASVGTGELKGIYYPVGRAICEIVNRDIRTNGVRCSPEATPGSVYNVDAIRSGELEFGIVQSDVAYAAYNGKGAFAEKPFRELRSVLVLYPELVTIVARAGIHEIGDLGGKSINVGRPGSGTRSTWDTIRAAVGWKEAEGPRATDLPADTIPGALCTGTIDANMLVVGHPSAQVSALLARCAGNLVAINGPAIDSLVANAPYFREGRISGPLYGLTGDTPSFGVSAVLVTSAGMDERAVAAFAKAIIGQLATLKAKHAALTNLTVEEMVGGNFPAPLHPAASEVYKGLGLLK
jgi:TRAP transporter TAXI family solute receptor